MAEVQHTSSEPFTDSQNTFTNRHLSTNGKADPVPSEANADQESPRNLLQAFCQHTTAHGLGQVMNESLAAAKAWWMVIFITAMAANSWHLSTIILTYLDYPFHEVTETSLEYSKFPYVTLCNSDWKSRSEYQSMENDPHSELSMYRQLLNSIYKEEDWKGSVNYLTSSFGYYENLSEKDKWQLAHKLDDFILDCSYDGRKCHHSDFEVTMNPMYFSCFTFTAKGMDSDVSMHGPDHGLSLILYLETTNGSGSTSQIYNPKFPVANSVGVRVTVHEPNTVPNPVTSGIDAMPGHSTNIAYTVENFERLGSPYRECTDRKMLGDSKYAYSQEGCFSLCIQKYIMETCGCMSSRVSILGLTANMNYSKCGTYHRDLEALKVSLDCEDGAYKEMQKNRTLQDSCQCKVPCREMTYMKTISESYWPGEEYLYSFFNTYVRERAQRMGHRELKAYTNLREIYDVDMHNMTPEERDRIAKMTGANFARINVFVMDSKVMVKKEVPSYDFMSLGSDIGGTIGLWAGLSALTVMEVVMLVVKMIRLCCNRQSGTQK